MIMGSKKDIQKLILKAQNEPFERYYPHEKEKLYGEAFNLASELGDEKSKKIILWEIDLLNRTFGRVAESGEKEISDKWGWIVRNRAYGKVFRNEPFCTWDPKAVNYYKERFSDKRMKNPLQKARYAYAIWAFEHESYYAQKTIEFFIETAKIYLKNNWFGKSYKMLPFCFEFCVGLCLFLRDRGRFIWVLNELKTALETEFSLGEKRWVLDLIDVLSKTTVALRNYRGFDIDASIKTKFKIDFSKVEQLLSYYEKEGKFVLFRSCVNMLIPILSFLGRKKKVFEYELEIPDSFVREADKREPFVASKFYFDALEYYKSLESKYPNKRTLIRLRIEEVTKKHKEAEERAKYREFKTKITITDEQMDTFLKEMDAPTPEGVIENLIKRTEFVPKYDEVVTFVKKLREKHPLQFLFPIYVSDREKVVARHMSESEILDFKIREQLQMEAKFMDIFLKETFHKFDEKLTQDNIFSFLVNSATNISKSRLEIIHKGLERHFAGDYVSSIHILIPQIEEILRQMLENAGYVAQVREKTGLREQQLRGLLENENTVDLLGKDFVEYLKVRLTDVDMENLRNLVCHGLVEIEQCNETNSILSIFIILKLSTAGA